jgi:hypothetical protein
VEDTRPLWELVLVGLLSGAAGAFLTTLMRIGHEQSEALRARMFAAADDFATGLMQALMALSEFDADQADELRLSGKVPAMVEEGKRRRDEALARMGRVQLLFGESPATLAAYASLKALATALTRLEEANPLDRKSAAPIAADLQLATAKMLDFNQQARKAITRRRWKD